MSRLANSLACAMLLALASCGESATETAGEGVEALPTETMSPIDMATDFPPIDEEPVVVPMPEPSPYCGLTMTDETPEQCDRFEVQYRDLDAGVDAFRVDEEMTADEPVDVVYALKRLPASVQGGAGELADAIDGPGTTPPAAGEPAPDGPTMAEIDAAIEEASDDVSELIPGSDEAEVQTDVLKVGRIMVACLDGDSSFDIKPEKCQQKNTRENVETVWRWQVTPSKPGERYVLHLTSRVTVIGSDGEPRPIPNVSRTARIKVVVDGYGKTTRFFGSLEKWVTTPMGVIAALTALLAALAGLVAAWRKLRGSVSGASGDGDDS